MKINKMRNNNSSNHTKKDKDDDNSKLSIDFSLITDNKIEPIDLLIEEDLKETLPYLKEQRLFLEDTKYYKLEIESMETSIPRIIHISGIVLEHLQKAEFIERNLRKMWDECNNEKDRKKKKTIILRMIAIKYYLTNYDKVIKDIFTEEINHNK